MHNSREQVQGAQRLELSAHFIIDGTFECPICDVATVKF